MTSPTTTTRATEMAAALRQLADDLDAGKLVPPFAIEADCFWAEGMSRRLTADDARDAMAAAPGGWGKRYLDNYLAYRKDYGGGVTYELTLDRTQVCRRVQTGVKEIPATEARTEPTFKWVCDTDAAPFTGCPRCDGTTAHSPDCPDGTGF